MPIRRSQPSVVRTSETFFVKERSTTTETKASSAAQPVSSSQQTSMAARLIEAKRKRAQGKQ